MRDQECQCKCFCQKQTRGCHFSPYDCLANKEPFTGLLDPRPMQELSDPMSGIDSSEKARFLCHFATVIPWVLPLLPPDHSNKSREFIQFILQFSHQYSMVLEGALALGASHLIRCFPTVDDLGSHSEKHRLVSEKHKLLNPKSQGTGQRRGTEEMEALMARHYLVYLSEVSEGTSSASHLSHLGAARDILIDILNTGLSVDEPLVNVFIHHDILASVTIPSRIWNMDAFHRRVIGADQFLPLAIIANIATLHVHATQATVLPASAISRAVGIWHDLEKPQPSVLDKLPPEYRTIHHTYTSTCFIWLYSILYPDGIEDEKVQLVVSQGLEDLLALGAGASRPFLLFPIFIVGMACIRHEDRDSLGVLLDWLDSSCLLADIEVCCRLIRRSWEIFDAGQARSWDWMRLMEAEGMNLIIL